ncbi:antibiotic biosynthesis monooxygenase [Pseudonocardia sp. HH130630-07]|uniref:antibiotic biosynthesis monooxygenase n=1 Tax=Pseudonocardia sp. HH130630-07 TaxID=1690815 RepID=UPI0008153F33|nr:antibiotic biosynthesis monooxygenase [Pseudonocardia sp. HH130630-07]ANY07752.1 hypothetical protein AFB00_17265 [Pseudonocardia sp. HH130630-07]
MSAPAAARRRTAVTVIATRTARPGHEQGLAADLQRVCDALGRRPGIRGTALLVPDEPDRGAVLVYRFASRRTCGAWHESVEHRRLVELSAGFTDAAPHERDADAQDAWFAGRDGRVVRPPRRWKTWIVSSVAIWCLITAITLAAGPWLAVLPAPLRFALLVPVMGALLTWLVMPALARLLTGWLYP